jgi:hypothetical protein
VCACVVSDVKLCVRVSSVTLNRVCVCVVSDIKLCVRVSSVALNCVCMHVHMCVCVCVCVFYCHDVELHLLCCLDGIYTLDVKTNKSC